MSDRAHHCPFLNRADHRCSGAFTIERLTHAFEHCFDSYKSCGVYQELLLERQARRGSAGDADATRQHVWMTACRVPRPADATTPTTKLVQVRLAGAVTAGAAAGGANGYAKRVA